MKKPLTHIKNEKGMATIETIPLIMVFVFMLCYEFGVFGIIHTGIMQSISARSYAFEVFRNRSNLVYYRDTSGVGGFFRNVGNRTHGIASEKRTDADIKDGMASERPLRVGIPMEADVQSRNDLARHNEKVFDQKLVGFQKRNQQVDVSPVWIQVQYGICLDARCGG